ncbi:MAG TPA: hypothetical protein VN132_14095 [Bdellovibrio sp.]|nr:hypothetical protein [Bdellovibrio sp.]
MKNFLVILMMIVSVNTVFASPEPIAADKLELYKKAVRLAVNTRVGADPLAYVCHGGGRPLSERVGYSTSATIDKSGAQPVFTFRYNFDGSNSQSSD